MTRNTAPVPFEVMLKRFVKATAPLIGALRRSRRFTPTPTHRARKNRGKQLERRNAQLSAQKE